MNDVSFHLQVVDVVVKSLSHITHGGVIRERELAMKQDSLLNILHDLLSMPGTTVTLTHHTNGELSCWMVDGMKFAGGSTVALKGATFGEDELRQILSSTKENIHQRATKPPPRIS